MVKLTDLGIEKREISKSSVYKFNQTIRENISKQKIDHFYEVTELINDLINQRSIFKE